MSDTEDEHSDGGNSTIKDNEDAMKFMMENLQKQLKEMSTQLAEEKDERERLAAILNSQSHLPGTSHLNPSATEFNSTPNERNCIPPNHTGARKKIIDLPSFTGKAEEWPTFHVSYKESTSCMQYSNWENHLRLVKALTGDAKESVSALLIHPNNVNEVMKELERQYGQPEQLLKSQMEKVCRIPQIPESQLDMLIPFAVKVRNLAAFLETINSIPYLANPNLIQDLVQKLPPSKRLDWGIYSIKIKPYVTVRDFSNWVSELAHVVSVVNVSSGVNVSSSIKKNQPKSVHHASTAKDNSFSCVVCKANHKIIDCPNFKEQPLTDRWELVKKLRLCFACLRFGHQTALCRSKRACGISNCQKTHHNLLHDEATDEVRVMHTNNLATADNQPQIVDVWFKIIPVKLYGNGRSVSTYAMIDEGASVTLVDETILSELQVRGKESQLTVKWFGNKSTSNSSQTVNLDVSGIKDNADRFELKNVRSVKNINLPTQSINVKSLSANQQVIKNLPICDYSRVKPMILIGLDNNYVGVPSRTVTSKHCSGPTAIKTKLGWLVYGPVYTNKANVRDHYVHFIKKPEEELDKIIEDYFTTENFGIKVAAKVESDEEIHANHLLQTTTTKLDKRYQSGLLWKTQNISLPNNYEMAKKRLINMENKMNRNPEYKELYKAAVNNFIDKQYARKLSRSEAVVENSKTWYLPHFLTSNINKPGKWRLVFDAAAEYQGIALNDCLLKGPDLYNSLVKVLYNFRLGAIAVTGDIREMFNQVVIQPSDRFAQLFLWRGGDPMKPIDVYMMDRMTFGLKCSPATAQYIRNVNALQYAHSQPEAVKSITEFHYVDDFIDSFDNVCEAKDISVSIKKIHEEAGFELRGFQSNSREVKSFLNGTIDDLNVKPMSLDASTEKILGMFWETEKDVFKFHLKFNRVKTEVIDGSRRPTKRELLSILMSVFDPFGFLANFTIHIKIMMQSIWRLQVKWDESIPDEINNAWMMWKSELVKVKEFEIPRHYFIGLSNTMDIQLHTFVDASQDAFAAVSYLRINDGNKVCLRLVAGKTRCSPIKKLMSIPRLELQAAVLGVRLCNSIEENHSFTVSQKFFWSDSSTVINWIKSDHRRYKPFVAHRIAEILESTKTSEWNWISTQLNVADEATRARFPPNYDPDGVWKRGPKFLLDDQQDWPTAEINMDESNNEELRNKYACNVIEVCHIIDFKRFSNYGKLKRTIGWILRFLNNKFNPQHKVTGELCVNELKRAEHAICRLVQKEAFSNDVFILKSKKELPRQSHLIKLSPNLDENEVLRVNGRIRRCSAVSVETKNPIILPKEHYVSWLIVKFYHSSLRHQNDSAIVSEVRLKFCIPSLKSLVKKVRKECVICQINSVKPKPPIMGELPIDRMSPFVRPFTYTGVDYFGPYYVSIGRRREKRWVALFTCMTVRAVHLEVAADLSTDSCLMCIRNFVNRRGKPIRIRSDNGTNFVGATKELHEAIGGIDQEKIKSSLAMTEIEWKFNCPENPHAGGAWERLVKAVKDVLHYTLKEEAPRVEVFQSVLIEAECLVNSRPLTEVPLSHEEDDPITPNHFLIGTTNSTQTPAREEDLKLWCLRKQWRIAQELNNRLWRKWIRDYLPKLITRSKWFSKSDPLKLGDIVLICDGDFSKRKLCKGVVIEVFTAEDGQVRSAKVKTSTGVLKRPASKLAVLKVNSESNRFTGGGVESK